MEASIYKTGILLLTLVLMALPLTGQTTGEVLDQQIETIGASRGADSEEIAAREAAEMYWSYAAEYLLQDEGIFILSSATAPIYGKFDRIRFFFVEKDQLPALSYLEDAEFEELLPLVAANASEPEDLNAADEGMEDMYLFVFDMTRSEPSIDLGLYSDGTLADIALAYSTSVNRNGWRFIMAEGSFRFGSKAAYKLYTAESRNAVPRVLSVLSVKN